MNDETRAALVESIAKRIDTFAEHVGYGDPDVTREEASSYIAEIEEALLTDRAATDAEPDGETVERVGTAIAEALGASIGPDGYRVYVDWDALVQASRAAIAAMPSGRDDDVVTRTLDANTSTPPLHMAAVMSGGDPNWLDAALDSVDFEVLHLEITHSAPREYGAEIYDHGGNQGFTGYGPTRREAILDAVRKAKEASGAK